jgi:glycerol kinase
MSKYVLAIDTGSTNVMSMVVGEDGRELGRATKRLGRSYPAPGHLEHDPEEIWSIVKETVGRAVDKAGIALGDLDAIGLTGQRSTAIIWERATGRPLSPAVSWQDQRGAARAAELMAEGFFTVVSTTPASKLESMLAAIPDGIARMRRGELAWGTIDSYLVYCMTDGALHITDCSNVCGTGYYDYFEKWDWIDELIELQGLDRSMFPEVVDTAGLLGVTSSRAFGAEIPIGAIIGDQQSSAYAQGCIEPGLGKITFGTSGTCDVNTGNDLKMAQGSYPLVLWRRGEERTYCVEGMVYTAGAVFDWLAGLGMIESPAHAEIVAGTVENCNGVTFLPSLQGLGTPHVEPERHAVFGGLTLGATAGHMVRAAMEGVAFRVREMVERIYLDADLDQPKVIPVDGGAAAGNMLMQLHADILGCPVERMQPLDATAYGAAMLAGEACGIWEPWSINDLRRIERVFEPSWSEDRREESFNLWKKACQL